LRDTFIVATLFGIRAGEVCKSIRLLKQGAKDYYNPEYGVLEHFKYKDLFIRRSKKAYISVVDQEMIALARQSCDKWTVISHKLKRKNTPMHMAYCRKIFGTWLEKSKIDNEIIDLLQGRTPTSVFEKHYYRPDFKEEIEKVRACLEQLNLSIQ
jgi:intergrase/recombinase